MSWLQRPICWYREGQLMHYWPQRTRLNISRALLKCFSSEKRVGFEWEKRECHFRVMRGQVRRSPISPVPAVPLKGLTRALVWQMECHNHWTVMLNCRCCGDSSATSLLPHKSLKAIDFRGAPFLNLLSRSADILTARYGDESYLYSKIISQKTLYDVFSSNIEPRVVKNRIFSHFCLSWEMRIEAVNGYCVFSLAHPSAQLNATPNSVSRTM